MDGPRPQADLATPEREDVLLGRKHTDSLFFFSLDYNISFFATTRQYLLKGRSVSRGPTELVQQFACRGSSDQRKDAGRQIVDYGLAISLADPSEEEGGIYGTCSKDFYLPSWRLEGGWGGGSAPCVRRR